MLTAKVISKWLELRGEDGCINEYWISSLAQRHEDVAEAWKYGWQIEQLICDARIAKDPRSPAQFKHDFRERLASETDSPESANLILDAV